MVELMVVIIIIAVLLSLTAAVVFRFIGSQKVSNTKTTLNKLGPVLKANWNSVAEKAFRDISSGAATATQYSSYYTTIAGTTEPNRQKVIYVKLKLVQAFPMTFDEVLNWNPTFGSLPPLTVYVKKLQALGISGSSPTTAPYESSALLLMALQEGVSGQKFNAEDLGSAALGTFPAAGSNPTATIQALVDGWGSPLAFFRWPTGSPDLNPPPGSGTLTDLFGNPNFPQAGTNHDTTDPQGYLTSTAWLSNGAYQAAFQSAMRYTAPPQGASGAQTYTLYPILVSAGADSSQYSASLSPSDYHLGLDGNAAPITGNTDSLDNLSSAQQ
jgi:hypothetical protein